MTAEQIEQIGNEFDELHEQVKADLGDRDARYIRSIIAMQRRLALIGRLELFASRWRVPWALGAATLGMAKILENMEIGHNVLHGQWDWMNDPVINSRAWDWDTASTAEAWRHSHNYVHHTYTNILGKDRDLGYEIMRIDPQQKWHPVYLFQPFYNILLMMLFEWGVAVHDLDFTAIRSGEKDMKQVRKELKGIAGKARAQIAKDYIAWPLISGAGDDADRGGGDPAARSGRRQCAEPARAGPAPDPQAPAQAGAQQARAARAARRAAIVPRAVHAHADGQCDANIIRNVWSYAIIFCGHFPDQTYTFTQEEAKDESRGGWYVRQLIGAANIDGGPLFHVISGNLGYQVEHHLYPGHAEHSLRRDRAEGARDLPALRAALQQRPVPPAARHGPADDPPPGAAGGKPRPKPGAYDGPSIRGRASTISSRPPRPRRPRMPPRRAVFVLVGITVTEARDGVEADRSRTGQRHRYLR